jgi:hypothetical protein
LARFEALTMVSATWGLKTIRRANRGDIVSSKSVVGFRNEI